MKKTIYSLLFSLLIVVSYAQNTTKKQYKLICGGFYNLENLYDTINQPNVNDEDFTPNGNNKYTAKVFLDKLDKLSTVISEIGTDVTTDGLAFFGVAEIENKSVLESLNNTPKLKKRGYKIVHYDSPDTRGVDVGFIYNPKYFKPIYSKPLTVNTYPLGGDRPTRDVLWVQGLLDGDTINVFVNHWPSRRGGEALTAPYRKEGARTCKVVIDSLKAINPNVKTIIMGDLNDNPTDESVAKILNAKNKKEKVTNNNFMYNPWIDYYTKGIGTLGYNDTWSLFDQSIFSYGFLQKSNGYFLKEALIFNKPYLLSKFGKWKGYPFRTYDFSNYQGGYSDHLPTYFYLLKEIN